MKKKEGIEIKTKLDKNQVTKIANIVSKKICLAFPEHNLNQSDISNIISSINMYIAKIPENFSIASYSYKTNSIYLSDNLDLNNIDTLVIHECIHALQEIRNNRGKLLRLGLFDVIHHKGEGINEASVQLIASKTTNSPTDTVKYYDLYLKTESPLYYPIETALINQIIYFIGSYPLFHSTLCGNDIFKNTFIAKCNKKVFDTIENNFDLLLHYEEILGKYSKKIISYKNNSSKFNNLINKISYIKSKIAQITIETQNIILENCFNCEFNLIRDKDSLDTFQKRLYNFNQILISTDSYDFYNNYYCEMMNKLEEKRELIKLHGEITNLNNFQTDLLNISQEAYGIGFFQKLFSKIKLLIENAFLKQKN